MELAGNINFHIWLFDEALQEVLPRNLDKRYNNLTDKNMKRNLFKLYKWSLGNKRDSTKEDYADWLGDLNDWFSDYAKSTKTVVKGGKDKPVVPAKPDENDGDVDVVLE